MDLDLFTYAKTLLAARYGVDIPGLDKAQRAYDEAEPEGWWLPHGQRPLVDEVDPDEEEVGK